MSQPPYRYRVHGCRIESNFVVSGLQHFAEAPPARLAITLTRAYTLWDGEPSEYHPWRPDEVDPQNPDIRLQHWKGPDGYLIRFANRADFLVGPQGKSIRLYTEEAGPSLLTRDLLLGPVLATAMALQGAYALHGSCVGRDNFAVAFLGNNGNGKSTLATTFVADGWELLTDGMFVAALEDGRAFVQPGDPRIRVRRDAAGLLKDLPNIGDTPINEAGKYCVPVGESGWGRYAGAPRRLVVAYALEAAGPEADIVIGPCRGADAIMTAATNTYNAGSFENELLGPHLNYIDQFVKSVPLRRFRYGKRIENLGPMREALLADIAQFMPAE